MHWLIKVQLYLTKHFPPDEGLRKDTIATSCEVLPALANHMTMCHVTDDLSKKVTFLEFAHLNVSIVAEEEVRTELYFSLCVCVIYFSFNCSSASL